jgi:hypothetical protein
MNRYLIPLAFTIGLATAGWVGYGFVGTSWLALVMTLAISGVYVLGAWELKQFRDATTTLTDALESLQGSGEVPSSVATWLGRVSPSLQGAVRLRLEGERVALPGPALTPYLVGLLVMLGMLGTFLGMVVTFKGAVFALEGSTDLQAIRSALAAPIKGLGLSFGTSVAGVAASAMLGLMSAISRRERMNAARRLDSCIATVLRPFSRAHQRDESFKAVQVQANVLPKVADRLQSLMDQMERRNQQLNDQLTGRQDQFHREVKVAYAELAATVGQSLQDSLVASVRLAGETIQPVVQAAMTDIATESALQHARVSETVQTQLTGLGAEFSTTARSLLKTVGESVAQSQAAQSQSDQQRLQAWSRTLESSAAKLHSEWQQAGANTLSAQQTICQTLEATAMRISAGSAEQTRQAMDSVGHLLEKSEALINSRIAAEAEWMTHQGARMDQLATLWRAELATLREEEDQRGQAAVGRLGELQDALASQLATLGVALEAPLSRLMETASEAPRAAAELIAQLRQEMTRLSERDNVALDERAGLMTRINALLEATDHTAREQRAAVESLVTSASAVLDQTGGQFTRMLDAQTQRASEMTDHVSASAVELAALGETFQHAVTLFNASNDKLVTSLQRVESAIGQSMERSDEQLAYYVGQAREVIDLSLSSQKAVVEDLRRLHGKQVASSESTL